MIVVVFTVQTFSLVGAIVFEIPDARELSFGRRISLQLPPRGLRLIHSCLSKIDQYQSSWFTVHGSRFVVRGSWLRETGREKYSYE